MLKQSASVVSDTREAYPVKRRSLLVGTFHEQLGTI
jgi:hypothetical protein